MTFRLANVAGRAALVDGDAVHDLEAASAGALGPDPMAAVAAHRRLHDLAPGLADRTPETTLAAAHLGPPVPRPRQVFGIGLNYADHIAESGVPTPEVPVVFTKFAGCIVGPTDDVVLHGDMDDWEAEVVVVIGTTARRVAAADAWSHVAGITAGQDVSDRALQFAASPPHFDLGKSHDTYGPTGPVLVSPDALDDPDDIALSCTVNGREVQRSSTRHLLFGVPALIEYLSGVLTLHPGDLVFTGTPSGVGMATSTFLAPGDVVVTEVAGVGTMTNRCVT